MSADSAPASGSGGIEVRDLVMRFGAVEALCSIDLDVAPGTVMALLGPNGAGKTTAVRIISTLLTPTSGTVTVAGVDTAADPHRVRGLIGLSGQFAAVDPVLTGVENLTMVARLAGYTRRAARRRALDLLEQFDIADAGTRRVAGYSGGMRRRLDLAGALVASPPVVILDEPTAGLDPTSRLGLWAAVRELVAGGSTVLLTTQYLEEADQLADAATVIDRGTVIARGTPAQLKADFATATVTVVLANPIDRDRARQVLADRGIVLHGPEADPTCVTVATDDPGPATAQLVGALAVAGVEVVDTRTATPSLDDVFVHLTGAGEQAAS
ncbi:ABC transporter ATP-binding protein [Williamsia sp. Leaf354]|jgi:ABC-2 type transport system ATP-binding protein|uniref:ABC transporter ATP-binding protein n=1 Tax=Williamsia sp. Leaf354 TaxID=1736349 RepID=UPI000B1A07DD|nr:ATP-binding cassette domain-containing protein [Williamsia sp. Leaf354]